MFVRAKTGQCASRQMASNLEKLPEAEGLLKGLVGPLGSLSLACSLVPFFSQANGRTEDGPEA